MSDLLAELERIAALPPDQRSAWAARLLVRGLSSAGERCLRAAAVARHFDAELLRRLVPSLSSGEVVDAIEELVRLGLSEAEPDGWQLRADVRRVYFREWLQQPSNEFRAINQTLADEHGRRAAREHDVQSLIYAAFHAVGLDQVSGLATVEALFDGLRTGSRTGAAASLIELVHDYDPILEPVQMARLAHLEGRLAADRGQWTQAIEHFDRALEVDAIPNRLRVSALLNRGAASLRSGHAQEAIPVLLRAKEAAMLTPEAADDLRVLHRLASAYRETGNHTAAHAALQAYIDGAAAIGDARRIAQGYNAVGFLHLRLREPDAALEAFEESLRRLKPLGIESPRLLLNMGSAYAERSDWSRSRECLERSMAMSRNRGDVGAEAMALNNLSQVHLSRGNRGEAEAAADRAAALLASVHDFRGAGHAARNLARIQQVGGGSLARTAAEASAQRAIGWFHRAGAEDDALATQLEFGDAGPRQRIPWWAWTAIGLGASSLLLIWWWLG